MASTAIRDSSSPSPLFELEPLATTGRLPLCVSPREAGVPLHAVRAELAAYARQHLLDSGGLLFRGFTLSGVDEFREFAAAFGSPLLGYEFGSTPRTRVADGLYSSTEYPEHQRIPLHNEQSYSLCWPLKIWFHCVVPAQTGGETPIADSRQVFDAVPAGIRERWSSRRLMYVRNYGGGLDVPWQQVFNTSSRAQVEAYCRANEIAWEWKDDGELRTRQVCQAVARHPSTRQWVWFNQAHLFHVSALAPEVRETLLELVAPEELPRNVYYGDGAPIEDSILDEVRAALDAAQVVFPWQAHDILMLDNMLVAHARAPFRGPRKVVVAMAEACRG